MNIFFRLLRLPLVAKAMPLPIRVASLAVSALIVSKTVNGKVVNAPTPHLLPPAVGHPGPVHESIQLHDFGFFRTVKKIFMLDDNSVNTDFLIKAVRWLYKTTVSNTKTLFTGKKPFETGPQNSMGFVPQSAIFDVPSSAPDKDVFIMVINDTTLMGATALLVIVIKCAGAYITYRIAIFVARRSTRYVAYLLGVKTTTKKSVRSRKKPTKVFNYKDYI